LAKVNAITCVNQRERIKAIAVSPGIAKVSDITGIDERKAGKPCAVFPYT